MIYELGDATLNSLIEFFQKQQMETMKEANTICDVKESKKIQKQITIFNNLAMNLMKLRDVRKQT